MIPMKSNVSITGKTMDFIGFYNPILSIVFHVKSLDIIGFYNPSLSIVFPFGNHWISMDIHGYHWSKKNIGFISAGEAWATHFPTAIICRDIYIYN